MARHTALLKDGCNVVGEGDFGARLGWQGLRFSRGPRRAREQRRNYHNHCTCPKGKWNILKEGLRRVFHGIWISFGRPAQLSAAIVKLRIEKPYISNYNAVLVHGAMKSLALEVLLHVRDLMARSSREESMKAPTSKKGHRRVAFFERVLDSS